MIEVVREEERPQESGLRPDAGPDLEASGTERSRGVILPVSTTATSARTNGRCDSNAVGRFPSIEALVQRTGLRRDELTTLADIGALNAFTNERRSALWQVERAVRACGRLFERERSERSTRTRRTIRTISLPPMTDTERLHADYAGTGLTSAPTDGAAPRATGAAWRAARLGSSARARWRVSACRAW